MPKYESKKSLIDEITKSAKLFIDEFRSINNLRASAKIKIYP
ncbi:hypothetical protein [Weizmannia sp. FSL W8-0401]